MKPLYHFGVIIPGRQKGPSWSPPKVTHIPYCGAANGLVGNPSDGDHTGASPCLNCMIGAEYMRGGVLGQHEQELEDYHAGLHEAFRERIYEIGNGPEVSG